MFKCLLFPFFFLFSFLLPLLSIIICTKLYFLVYSTFTFFVCYICQLFHSLPSSFLLHRLITVDRPCQRTGCVITPITIIIPDWTVLFDTIAAKFPSHICDIMVIYYFRIVTNSNTTKDMLFAFQTYSRHGI